MNDTLASKLTQTWGNWLQQTPWDYFSTYTFRYDISSSRNERYMLKLEESLQKHAISHKIFWVVEPTSNGFQSHSHFLIRGEEAKEHIFQFYQSKKLITSRNVVNDPYDKKLGANYYVSKTLHHAKAMYGMSYSADFQ